MLQVGDIIDIKYRVWRTVNGTDEMFDRWVRAEIIDTVDGKHPLAKLADGQITEIRSFMPLRLIANAAREGARLAA